METGDFNNDGSIDVVTADRADNTFSVLYGNGDGSFAARVTYESSGADTVTTGDVNGDGVDDVLFGTGGTDRILVYLSNGDGSFQAAETYNELDAVNSVQLGDVNGDGVADLVSAINDLTDNFISVRLGTGGGSFGESTTFNTGEGVRIGPLADLNGDGLLDTIATNVTDNTLGVLLGNADGSFKANVTIESGPDYYLSATADFDNDGAVDIAASDVNGDRVRVLLGNSTQVTTQERFNLSTVDGARAALDTLREYQVLGHHHHGHYLDLQRESVHRHQKTVKEKNQRCMDGSHCAPQAL